MILDRGAEGRRSLVDHARRDNPPPLAQFNWHGLADAAAANARQGAEGLAGALDRYPAPRRATLQASFLGEQIPPDATDTERAWLTRARDARQWAEAAIAAYDLLADRAGARERAGYRDSAMHLRAHLMTRIGIIPGDRVLDSDTLLAYYPDGLTLSADEAAVSARTVRERLRGGKKTPDLTAELRALRGIKNRLAPLVFLVGGGQFEPPPALQPWLDIHEQLP